MKSKTPIFPMLFLAGLLAPVVACSQFLENKMDISLGYALGRFTGDKFSGNSGIPFPSLYNNFRNVNAFTIQGQYKLLPHLSVGLKLQHTKGSDWKMDAASVYNGAQVSLFSAAPVVQFQTKFSQTGIFNRMKFFLSVSPSVGIATTSLENSLKSLSYEGVEFFDDRVSAQSHYRGISIGAGADFNLSQFTGLRLNYSNERVWIKTPLATDNGFTLSMVTLSVYRKLMINRQFYKL